MGKIFTVTLNSAIDNYIEIRNFKNRAVVTAIDSKLFPSGKAINSSRTIAALNRTVWAYSFVGKQEISLYTGISSRLLKLKLFPVTGSTRSNITIVDSNHNLVQHIKTSGYQVDAKRYQDFITSIRNQLSPKDIVIISGSVPTGLPENIFEKLIKVCNKIGATVLFDSREPFLHSGIKARPYAIKPNMEELQSISARRLSSIKEIVAISKGLNDKGIEIVFVSRGSKGVILTKKGHPGYWTANVQLDEIKHSGDEIGCGDAMSGGIAIALSEGLNTEDMLRLSVACGAANLLTKGPGLVNPDDVKRLLQRVTLKYRS